MKFEKVIFWLFWVTAFIFFAYLYWFVIPDDTTSKEDIAKFSFAIALCILIIISMLDDNIKFFSYMLVILSAAVLPFWPVWLGILWIILYTGKQFFSYITNMEEKFS